MKHYVRRSSRNQTLVVDTGQQQHQDNHRGPASNTGSHLLTGALAKEQEADPYSFEFEDKQVKDTDCIGTSIVEVQASQKKAAQVIHQEPSGDAYTTLASHAHTNLCSPVAGFVTGQEGQ